MFIKYSGFWVVFTILFCIGSFPINPVLAVDELPFQGEFDGLESRLFEREQQAETVFLGVLDGDGTLQEKARASLGMAIIHLRYRRLDDAEALLTDVRIGGGGWQTELDACWWLGVLNIHRKRTVEAMENFQAGFNLARFHGSEREAPFRIAIKRVVDIVTGQFGKYTPRKLDVKFREEFGSPLRLFWNSDNRLVILGKKGQAGMVALGSEGRSWMPLTVKEIDTLGMDTDGTCLFLTGSQIYREKGKVPVSINVKRRKFSGVTWTTPGEYWVLNRKTPSIDRLSADGKLLTSISKFKIDSDDLIVADTVGGTWFLSNKLGQLIYFNSAGKEGGHHSLEQTSWSISKPRDLDIDPMGFVYILDIDENRLIVLYPDGSYAGRLNLKQIISGILAPSSVAIDEEGRIYVNDRKRNTVYSFE